MEERRMTDNSNFNDIDFEKRYIVVIVKDPLAKDGYEFYTPDDVITKDEKSRCILTYYYKKLDKLRNPITIIEDISGDKFRGREKIIAHFEINFALKYSVERDGFYKL
jgi:hypothetical protein